jgi:hypothetical protein
MFARFDPINMAWKWDNEGGRYIADIEAIDNPDLDDRLSTALTSPLAVLGLCMQLYEGRAIPFDKVWIELKGLSE